VNDCLGSIDSRRSIRDLSGEVSDEALETILHAGARAPSPHNTQPWRFVVLGQRSKLKLADLMYRKYIDRFKNEPGAEEKAAKLRKRLRDAPLAILLCLDRSRIRSSAGREMIEWLMATQSLAAVAENMWLAARSVGLDAMWIAAPLAIGDHMRYELGLGYSLEPQILMAFGRRSKEPGPKQELGWRELATFLE
jgi:nitroreductase